jgi:hypothetical protein
MVQLQSQPVFSGFNLRKIAVVYANSKSNSGAVVHPTANTRHWKVSISAVQWQLITKTCRENHFSSIKLMLLAHCVKAAAAASTELRWLLILYDASLASVGPGRPTACLITQS